MSLRERQQVFSHCCTTGHPCCSKNCHNKVLVSVRTCRAWEMVKEEEEGEGGRKKAQRDAGETLERIKMMLMFSERRLWCSATVSFFISLISSAIKLLHAVWMTGCCLKTQSQHSSFWWLALQRYVAFKSLFYTSVEEIKKIWRREASMYNAGRRRHTSRQTHKKVCSHTANTHWAIKLGGAGLCVSLCMFWRGVISDLFPSLDCTTNVTELTS